MATAFDFPEEHRNFNVMMDCQETWQLVNGEFFNVDNMTNEELCQAIVDDVLGVTIWEIQTGTKADFSKKDLLCRLNIDQKIRVELAMLHQSIAGLFIMKDEQIRIKMNHNILQAAMNFCGVYYTGFKMPDGCISVCRDADVNLEYLAASLAFDLTAKGLPKSNSLQ